MVSSTFSLVVLDPATKTFGSAVASRYCAVGSGVPFSAAGVESLMVSNFSPKKLDRSRHIGNRGLGFRSVLRLLTV